jgi:hypothetical protein
MSENNERAERISSEAKKIIRYFCAGGYTAGEAKNILEETGHILNAMLDQCVFESTGFEDSEGGTLYPEQYDLVTSVSA